MITLLKIKMLGYIFSRSEPEFPSFWMLSKIQSFIQQVFSKLHQKYDFSSVRSNIIYPVLPFSVCHRVHQFELYGSLPIWVDRRFGSFAKMDAKTDRPIEQDAESWSTRLNSKKNLDQFPFRPSA